MADRVIRAIITADAAQAQADMDALNAQSAKMAAQQQAELDATAAAADATSADISAAMEAMEADYAGAGLASGDMAASVDAAMADLKASLLTTDGIANTTAGDVAAAMQGVGTESEVAAERMSASMAQIDGAVALASSDTATASAEMDASMESAGTAAEAAKVSFMGLSAETLGIAAVAAAVAGAGYESLKMADAFDKSTNSIAASAGISEKAAKAISDTFLDARNTTIYSAADISSAYAGVAAQLGTIEGHALTASQAMTVMNAAQNLATATGGSLDSTTADLAKVMQSYGIGVKGAAEASSVLYNAGKLTGLGVDGVTAAFTKLHSQLGMATPPLSQIGGLLDDLAKHGETGRQGLSAVTTAMSSMMSQADLTGGQIAQLSSSALANYQGFKALGLEVYNSQGAFVGMSSIIGQLQPKLEGMTQAQQMQTLQFAFGSAASQKLLTTILAGPAAYNADTAAVSKASAAHEAAAKQLQNLGDQWKEVTAWAENLGVQVGEVLMPALVTIGKGALGAAQAIVQDLQPAFSWISQQVGLVSNWIRDHWTTIKDVTVNIWNGIHEALVVVWDVISTSVKVAWDVISTTIGTAITLIVKTIEGVVDVVEFLVGVWHTVTEDITTFVSGAVDVFEGLPKDIERVFSGAGTWLYDIGKDIIQGLINGIKGMVSDVENAVKGLGKDVLNVAKDVLGIFSPSTEFAAIGVQITAGLAQGVRGSSSVATDAVSQMVHSVSLTGASSMTEGGGSLGAAGGVSMPVTINALSNEPSDIMNALAMYVQRNGRVPAQVRRAFGGTA